MKYQSGVGNWNVLFWKGWSWMFWPYQGNFPPHPQFFFRNKFLSKATRSYKTSCFWQIGIFQRRRTEPGALGSSACRQNRLEERSWPREAGARWAPVHRAWQHPASAEGPAEPSHSSTEGSASSSAADWAVAPQLSWWQLSAKLPSAPADVWDVNSQ